VIRAWWKQWGVVDVVLLVPGLLLGVLCAVRGSSFGWQNLGDSLLQNAVVEVLAAWITIRVIERILRSHEDERATRAALVAAVEDVVQASHRLLWNYTRGELDILHAALERVNRVYERQLRAKLSDAERKAYDALRTEALYFLTDVRTHAKSMLMAIGDLVNAPIDGTEPALDSLIREIQEYAATKRNPTTLARAIEAFKSRASREPDTRRSHLERIAENVGKAAFTSRPNETIQALIAKTGELADMLLSV
jgi:hypothetical protein